MKTVKIGLGIFLTCVVSFAPIAYIIATQAVVPGFVFYLPCLNNISNFFIYLFVDKAFRTWLRQTLCCKSAKSKSRTFDETPSDSLHKTEKQ